MYACQIDIVHKRHWHFLDVICRKFAKKPSDYKFVCKVLNVVYVDLKVCLDLDSVFNRFWRFQAIFHTDSIFIGIL